MESTSLPLDLESHRQQERSFPAAVSMAGPSSPFVSPLDRSSPTPSPRRHNENSQSLNPTPLLSHVDPCFSAPPFQ
ncbi:hypothetical protein C2845_PM03G36030 [Panicum miliaceum]|uniref:Uncharacterized protein n=1 Tax=Panicum miliaceum TaxID=4540 RepID=A0A3L6TE02_PANMI|nr:hypothetical protein C2845_PM03G36030 [Panicum miliaceum]